MSSLLSILHTTEEPIRTAPERDPGDGMKWKQVWTMTDEFNKNYLKRKWYALENY